MSKRKGFPEIDSELHSVHYIYCKYLTEFLIVRQLVSASRCFAWEQGEILKQKKSVHINLCVNGLLKMCCERSNTLKAKSLCDIKLR